MIRAIRRTRERAHAEAETGLRGRCLYAASVLGALAFSLAAADAMLSTLLDSIAVVAGILAVRMPVPPAETKAVGRTRIHRVGFPVGEDPFLGLRHLN
jgi:hypothetical protein